jgi:hypothetical protein
MRGPWTTVKGKYGNTGEDGKWSRRRGVDNRDDISNKGTNGIEHVFDHNGTGCLTSTKVIRT